MAKNFWEADKPAGDAEFWKADTPIDQPASTQPAAPTVASDAEIDQQVTAGQDQTADMTRPYFGTQGMTGTRKAGSIAQMEARRAQEIEDKSVRLRDTEQEMDRLSEINPGRERESLRALAESTVSQPKKFAAPVDRVKQYTDRGYSQDDAKSNAEFDAGVENRLNRRAQQALPDERGDRVGLAYNPNTEAKRVAAEIKDREEANENQEIRARAEAVGPEISGLARGFGQSVGLGKAAIGFFGDLLGSETVKQWGIEGYNDTMRKVGAMTLAKDFTDIENAGDAATYIRETLAYGAFQAAQAIASGGVGGIAGKAIGKEALGKVVGLATTNVAQELGSIYGEAQEEARRTGKPAPSLGQVAVNAVIAASIDTVADKSGLDAVGKNIFKKNMLSRMAHGASTQVAIQGGTEAAQKVFEEIGAGKDPFREGVLKEYVNEAAAGGLMGGVPGAIGGIRKPEPEQPSAEQLARSKGFLVSNPEADAARIQRLRDAGEKAAADLLQRRMDTQSADAELAGLQLPAAQAPEFQDTYRSLRTAGVKPAEAAARTAVITDFRAAATAAGMSDKAIAAALDAGQKKGLADLPTFLHRYTQSLASRGAVQAVDLGPQLEAARDAGLDAATESLYGDVQQTMEAAQALESQQDVPAAPEAVQAVTNIENLLDTGNDIQLTPEADAAHAAATSPLNDLAEPTQAQKDAGNYKVGRLRIAGLDISVENPQGSTRSGTDPDGNAWETPMRHHYGYFRGTTATDGDKLDVFVVPGTPQDYRGPVFVVDQIDPRTGKLDEHKVILGARDEAEAEAIYRSNYSADWQGLGAITRLPLPAFKAWAATGNKKEALGDIQSTPQQTAQAAQATAPSATADEAPGTGDGTQRGEQGTVQPDGAADGVAATKQPAAVAPAAAPLPAAEGQDTGRKLTAVRNAGGKFQAVDDSGNVIPGSPEFDTGPEADHWRRQQGRKPAAPEPTADKAEAKPERPVNLIELRKRAAVLKALRKCLEA